MIEFLTLFLGGIVTGPTEIELMVNDDVAAVEIRLDESSLAVLRAPPWEIEIDFSEELEPHLLEAIAFDRSGHELDRVRQWINLAPKTVEIGIVLDRDPETDTVSARVTWQSIAAEGDPIRVRAFFDDQPLNVVDPRNIVLPPHDPGSFHHLRVELEFPEELGSFAEVTFGGVYGDTVDSELTPFPVDLLERKKLPKVVEMQRWFHSEGEPLAVHSTEKGLADIIVVRDPVAVTYLEKLLTRLNRLTSYKLVKMDQRLRFLSTQPIAQPGGGVPFELFKLSPSVKIGDGGLLATLVSRDPEQQTEPMARLADAVAVAGLSANQGGRRRAVVLITTGSSVDASESEPQQVRRYLARLGVPLFVWSPLKKVTEAGAWGPAVSISSEGRLRTAYKEMSRRLDRQRVVWFTGLHRPQTITLDPAVDGVMLVR